jgi:hypothetical protein
LQPSPASFVSSNDFLRFVFNPISTVNQFDLSTFQSDFDFDLDLDLIRDNSSATLSTMFENCEIGSTSDLCKYACLFDLVWFLFNSIRNQIEIDFWGQSFKDSILTIANLIVATLTRVLLMILTYGLKVIPNPILLNLVG